MEWIIKYNWNYYYFYYILLLLLFHKIHSFFILNILHQVMCSFARCSGISELCNVIMELKLEFELLLSAAFITISPYSSIAIDWSHSAHIPHRINNYNITIPFAFNMNRTTSSDVSYDYNYHFMWLCVCMCECWIIVITILLFNNLNLIDTPSSRSKTSQATRCAGIGVSICIMAEYAIHN